MITSSDKAKYPLPEKPVKPGGLIEKCDSLVDIREVMKPMHLWAPSGSFASWKIYCPWHYEHSDQMDKNCRIYNSSNHIYCFALHGIITTTSLYSRWKAVSQMRAAEILLDERGLLSRPWRSWWEELQQARVDNQSKVLGSQNDALAALNARLLTDPIYVNHEFDFCVRREWGRVLSNLDKLWAHPQTTLDTLKLWLEKSLTRLIGAAIMDESQQQESL